MGPTLLPALIVWAAVIYTSRSYRHAQHDPRVASWWWGLVLLGAALTVLLRPIAFGIDHLLGIVNLARWMSHAFMLSAAYANGAFMLAMTGGAAATARRHRWLLSYLLLTLVILAVILWHDGLTVQTITFDTPRTTLHLIAYRVVYLAYFTLIVVTWMRACADYGRVTRDPIVKLSMGFALLGGCWALGYVGATLAQVLFPTAFGGIQTMDTIIAVCVLAAVICLITASTLPTWGPRIGVPTLARHVRRAAACWRISALWRLLVEATPDVALPLSVTWWSALLRPTSMELLLYRRVIEVLDSALVLGAYLEQDDEAGGEDTAPHVEPSSGALVDGLEDRHLMRLARADAGRLALALSRQQQEEAPATARGGHGDSALIQYRPSTHDEQVRYLELVARAFHAPASLNRGGRQVPRRARPLPSQSTVHRRQLLQFWRALKAIVLGVKGQAPRRPAKGYHDAR